MYKFSKIYYTIKERKKTVPTGTVKRRERKNDSENRIKKRS